ncbi:MAG: pentapeptide repeat-containing protein [Planctomycetaceae bacterium]|jgi:uncharacterized protein YjbI with pentapeptide repeats|nr:pentapeptide repeat-containing protein [Planctomycetaceae bacterium]
MKKIWTNIVFLFVFWVTFSLPSDIRADETDSAKQPADKVAFKLGYYADDADRFKDGVVGKELSGFSGKRLGVTSALIGNRGGGQRVIIHPPDFEFDEFALEEDKHLLRPVTWGEFYNTATYKNKHLRYVSIEADCESFPISLEGWKLEHVDFMSGFNIKDAELFDCRVKCPSFVLYDDATKQYRSYEEIPVNNKHFELFASTWNYKNNVMCQLNLNNFDLRKASFANKDISEMFIKGIMYDKDNPNENLFENAVIVSTTGVNLLPSGINKEQLYRTNNYRYHKSLSGIRVLFNNQFFADEQFDFSNLDISSADLINLSVRDKNKNEMNFTDAVINGSKIMLSDRSMNREMVYSTQSYKQGNLIGITFHGYAYSQLGNMRNWNLANQNLSNCRFRYVDLADADFTNAIITGVQFVDDYKNTSNLTIDQIKSTWNYKNDRMDGIKLPAEIQKQLDAEKRK